MDGLRKRLDAFKSFFTNKEESTQETNIIEITKCQKYLLLGFKILSWEDISGTLLVFLAVNILFWTITILQVQLLGLLFLTSLTGFGFDSLVDIDQLIDKENKQMNLQKIGQIHNCMNEVYFTIKAFRKDNPSSFCAFSSIFFLMMMVFAQKISGYTLVYFTILAIFFVPLLFKQLPPQTTSRIHEFIGNIISQRGVLLEDDLIPLQNGERDEVESVMTDKTADSVTNSLISGLNSMPSHLDGEDKESLEEDDLLPTSGYCVGAVSFTPGELSSDSDIENKEIRFDSTHFNSDSSSEEENLYPKQIDQTNERYLELLHDSCIDSSAASCNRPPTEGDSVLNNLMNVASASSNLMVNVIKSAVTTAANQALQKDHQTRKNSSSDSEFEIINYDEENDQ